MWPLPQGTIMELLSDCLHGESMLGKDQKGYVMSGFGLLLLIPVMIIIPVMLAVETQSGDLPNKFTQSDTVHRTFQDIKTDLRNQMFILGYKIDRKTFKVNEDGIITDAIHVFYTATQTSRYQSAYGENFVKVDVQKNFASQPLNTWDAWGGTAYLNNGYILIFANTTDNYLQPKTNIYLRNYTMTIKADSKITVVQGPEAETGHSQDYKETYVYYFVVNSNTANNQTATDAFNGFFSRIGNYISTGGMI